MSTADEQLIGRIRDSTRGAARVLCGLARRGKALERDDPQRAAQLLGAVSTHPLYKGGRLTFDMLEVEDVMLDEPSGDTPGPAELTEALNTAAAASTRMAELLLRLGTEARPAEPSAPDSELPRVRLAPAPEPEPEPNALPELTASDYLFDYVVLGLLDVLSRRLSARASGPRPHGDTS